MTDISLFKRLAVSVSPCSLMIAITLYLNASQFHHIVSYQAPRIQFIFWSTQLYRKTRGAFYMIIKS